VTTDEFLERFGESVRPTGRDRWQACCPAHDDRTPSLAISAKANGDRLIHCHAGCDAADVLAAAGLELRDLYVEPRRNGSNGSREIAAVYSYTDEDGQPLFEVVRFEPKGFAQRRPGRFWGLGDTRRVLYRLPRVREAIGRGEDVMVVEGEKDADRLHKLGIAATTCPMGVGKWRPSYTEALRGAKVTVVADRDEPGRAHACAVAEALRPVAETVDVVEPIVGKDISDHLAAGRGIAELVELAEVPSVRSAPSTPVPPRGWPAPLSGEAFYGLAGEVVRSIEPHSEADPAALLVQFHIAFGNACGRGAGFRVEGDLHATNLYAVLVGETAKARKGTSWGRVQQLMASGR
jgi:hypothetical protein